MVILYFFHPLIPGVSQQAFCRRDQHDNHNHTEYRTVRQVLHGFRLYIIEYAGSSIYSRDAKYTDSNIAAIIAFQVSTLDRGDILTPLARNTKILLAPGLSERTNAMCFHV